MGLIVNAINRRSPVDTSAEGPRLTAYGGVVAIHSAVNTGGSLTMVGMVKATIFNATNQAGGTLAADGNAVMKMVANEAGATLQFGPGSTAIMDASNTQRCCWALGASTAALEAGQGLKLKLESGQTRYCDAGRLVKGVQGLRRAEHLTRRSWEAIMDAAVLGECHHFARGMRRQREIEQADAAAPGSRPHVMPPRRPAAAAATSA